MKTFQLDHHADFETWRHTARAALAAALPPQSVSWRSADDRAPSLFASAGEPCQTATEATPAAVPKSFLELARAVACHTSAERFDLLYRLLFRLQDNRALLANTADPEVHRASRLAKAVRRDAHKMRAFVRFRKVERPGAAEHFVAWFEPEHHILRYTADFFVSRFAAMRWSILTPKGCLHWDGSAVAVAPPARRSDAPDGDPLEAYWSSYYASIFNPARLKVSAMTAEMPRKYWKNLPETAQVRDLIRSARARETGMIVAQPTTPNPSRMAHRECRTARAPMAHGEASTIDGLNRNVSGCRSCPLWQPATQAVPGRGPADADIMIVGEQPGDREDLAGEPFVGPAGERLRALLADARIDPASTYMTNAVKHFKFEPRGKRRIHKNPSAGEIDRCRWWLKQEIELIRPRVIIALGASALRGVTGRSGKVASLRGSALPIGEGRSLVVTYHPASLLRGHAGAGAEAELLQDLVLARETLLARLPRAD